MSRIGKKIIDLPSEVNVDFDKNTRKVAVKGKLGQLSMDIVSFVTLEIENGLVKVNISNTEDDFQKAVWGTVRSKIYNMVEGVNKGFTKEIELNGVGYKMELGTELTLYIGFSHPVKVKIPPDIKLNLNKNLLSGTSIDKELLGDFFSNLFRMKPCDVYKHKGFKFPGEFYRKKNGKKTK